MTGITMLFTPEEIERVMIELDKGAAFRSARRNLLQHLRNPPRLVEQRRTLGLERSVDGITATEHGLDVPFGWRVEREWHRDRSVISPLWLVWLLAPFRERWRLYRIAMRLGLWDVREGDYYHSGWLTCPAPIRRALWCFVNDRDEAPS